MCPLQNLAGLAAMTRYLAALGRRRPDQAMPSSSSPLTAQAPSSPRIREQQLR
jgi:hypothetical protein